MARRAKEVVLTGEAKKELEAMIRKRKISVALKDRISVILYASKGLTNNEISKKVGMNKNRVGKWRKRYIRLGLNGLKDAPRKGRPLVYNSEDRLKVITKACSSPENISHWSTRELEESYLERVWDKYELFNSI